MLISREKKGINNMQLGQAFSGDNLKWDHAGNFILG